MTDEEEFNNLRERLHKVIPGGAHTYSRGDDQFPEIAPPLLVKGKGAYTWDSKGRKFLDYGMALRAVTLGYANERVNRAAEAEMAKGVNLTRASMTELLAAEAIVDLIPSAEMVKFGKNGSNVTTAAVKIARAYTNKRYVCIPRQHPFFSFDDWFIGTTALKRGTLNEHSSTTLLFDYGDIASLSKLFDQYPDQIAAVMLEPATTLTPCGEGCCTCIKEPVDRCEACQSNGRHFLNKVQTLCRSKGALFILDEMITGFRWHQSGAQTFFDVEPDLTTFGKGMANGYSVAAITGKREFMEVGSILQSGMERTFLMSTTHGAEMPGLGAFMETIKIYKEENVVQDLWLYGAKLKNGFDELSKSHGLEEFVFTDGPPISLNYITKDINGDISTGFRTLLSQELIKHSVLMPWIAISQSHGDNELNITLEALEKAFKIYKHALDEGLDKYLQGHSIKPVFRKHN